MKPGLSVPVLFLYGVVYILLFESVFGIRLNLRRVRRQNVPDDEPVNVNRYLRRFGYMPDTMDFNSPVEPNPSVKYEALKTFQKFCKIPITGTVTEETLVQMRRPRCGCQDTYDMKKNESSSDSRSKRQAITRFRPMEFRAFRGWRARDLTWRLVGYPRNLDRNQVKSEIARAFQFWKEVSSLTFTEDNTSLRVNIAIDFPSYEDHNDRNPFDGAGGVLAHAFFPENGNTHFDIEERWVINSSRGFDVFTVAAHEFGHALGLGHSEEQRALMAPFYSGYVPNYTHHPDDVAGIQNIYGPPSTPRRTTRRPTTTTRRPTAPPRPRPPNTEPACNVRGIRGAMMDDNGDVFFFTHWRVFKPPYIERRGNELRNVDEIFGPARSMFPYAPWYLDAVFQLPNSTFFIRRRLVVRLGKQNDLRTRFRTGFDYGLTGVQERIRAAVAISVNNVYIFGTTKVWNFNSQTFESVRGSERDIVSEFPDVPLPIDAAFTTDGSIIHFIKGQTVFDFDLATRRVVDMENLASKFFGGECSTRAK